MLDKPDKLCYNFPKELNRTSIVHNNVTGGGVVMTACSCTFFNHRRKQMKDERKNDIENTTYRFLEEQGAVSIPVDVNALASKLGFKVKKTNFSDKAITGMILVNENEKIPNVDTNMFIAVSSWLDEQKARFILAHELGHFSLHKKAKQPLFAYRDTDQRSGSLVEDEAELYARALLMPRPSVKAAVRVYKEDEELSKEYGSLTAFISKIFNVSHKKAYDRLDELNVLC